MYSYWQIKTEKTFHNIKNYNIKNYISRNKYLWNKKTSIIFIITEIWNDSKQLYDFISPKNVYLKHGFSNNLKELLRLLNSL